MLIDRVELKNIKLYKDRTFNFHKGINVLSGPNGSGKSTVFEAIGYALFGVDAEAFIGSQKRFVRKGERSGSIVVHFTADDGSQYLVERRVGGAGWRLFRTAPDGKRTAVEVKNSADMEGALKKILGLQSEQSLKEQFLGIIGPLQSDFIGSFLTPGATRQEAFDKILGISVWREVFEQSVALKNEAVRQVERREEEIKIKKIETAPYDVLVERLRVQQQHLLTRRRDRDRTEADLMATAQAVAEMDRTKADIERLQRERAALEERANTLTVLKEHAEEAWRRAHQAQELCDSLRPAYREYGEADQALQPLRLQGEEAARLRQELWKLERDVEILQSRVDTRRQTLREKHERSAQARDQAAAQLTEAQAQLQTAQRLVRQAAESVQAYDAFQLKGRDLSSRPKSIQEQALKLIKDAAVSAEELARYEQRLRAREGLEALARQEDRIRADYEDAVARLSKLEARKRQLEEGGAKLADGVCPFFDESCLNLEEKGPGPQNFFGSQIRDMDLEMARLAEQKRALGGRLKTVRQAQHTLAQLVEVEGQYVREQNKLARSRELLHTLLEPVTSGGFLNDLAEWIGQAPEASQRQELLPFLDRRPLAIPLTDEWTTLAQSVIGACTALETTVVRVQEVLAQRKQWLDGQHRAAGENLARIQEQMRNLERSQTDAEREIQGLEKDKAQWLEERARLNQHKGLLAERAAAVGRYDGLEDRIQALENIKAAQADAYKQYLEHHQSAAEVAQREAEIAQRQAEIAEVAEAADRLRIRMDALLSGYRPEDHEAARQRQTHLTGQTERLKVEIRALEADVQRLENDKTHLDTIRQRIKTLESEAKQYRKTLRFVEDMREKVFREVSEQLSKHLRERISRSADRIYRTIARSDEELHWGDNYAIELVDLQEGAERRRYDEELSGGQVMSAVVALRLALLRAYGAKIGFFDEPTSNLDEQRRAQLALVFRSLDEGKSDVGSPWYDQLFLISHDVAFTQITDHIIYLEEEET